MPNDTSRLRTNEDIRAPVVLVIGADGERVGELPTEDAIRLAKEEELDLVEVAPLADPPVCKILNYGKHRYAQQKKEHLNKRKTASNELKSIRLRPRIGSHDLEIKVNRAKRFLEEGHRVQFNMQFRGREQAFTELGLEIMKDLEKTLTDIARVERSPWKEGRTMSMVLNPKK